MHVALVYNAKGDKSKLNLKDDFLNPSDSCLKLFQEFKNESLTSLKDNKDIFAEWDEVDTVLAVKEALEENHTVHLIEADELCYLKLIKNKPDIVFNIAEGLLGTSREAIMPGIYEMLGIPYTGSDPLTLAICLNKARTKEILSYYSIPNPAFKVTNIFEKSLFEKMRYPFVVKPLHEGSSKGIMNSSFVASENELRDEIMRIQQNYNQPALIEEFLPGREFTVAMLGNGEDLEMFPVVEFNLDLLPKGANKIYSYEAKWDWDTYDNPLHGIHICPAELDDNLRMNIENITKSTFYAMNCRDWCRIDIRLDSDGIPNVMELNPLPGIIPDPDAHSCFPSAARAKGLTYNQMINNVLNAAIKRYNIEN
jgi:D-alanine-D-alanine ligase